MTNQLAIPDLAELELMPIEQVMNDIYPLAIAALDEAEDMDQVNDIRHRIEGLVRYVNKKIPGEMQDRVKQLTKANKGNKLYIGACRQAGAYWDSVEHLKGRPPAMNDDEYSLLTSQQAGFTSRFDARRCVKASRLHEEDVRTYFEECHAQGRQITLSGIVHKYDLLNPKEVGGEPVNFDKKPLAHFLKTTSEKILKRMEDAEGAVYELMKSAADQLKDAEEIQADIEE